MHLDHKRALETPAALLLLLLQLAIVYQAMHLGSKFVGEERVFLEVEN